MIDDLESSPWDLLDESLILKIISYLFLAKDKTTLDAIMQTSRSLRLLAASSIPCAAIWAGYPTCLDRFPRHATLRALWVHMKPKESVQFFQEECRRLRTVHSAYITTTDRIIILQQHDIGAEINDDDDDVPALPPSSPGQDGHNDAADVVAALGAACSALTSLSIRRILDHGAPELRRERGDVLFSALFLHLPGITSLTLELSVEYRGGSTFRAMIASNELLGIKWASVLPKGLVHLRMPEVHIDRSLLEVLAGSMPNLLALVAHSFISDNILSQAHLPAPLPPMDSNGCCSWILLSLSSLPSFAVINSFSMWPGNLRIFTSEDSYWQVPLNLPSAADQVRTAGMKLARCREWDSSGRTFILKNTIEPSSTEGEACAVILSLWPLSAHLGSLSLIFWPITAPVLVSLGIALPHLTHLRLEQCVMNQGWGSATVCLTSLQEATIRCEIISHALLDEVMELAMVSPRALNLHVRSLTERAPCEAMEAYAKDSFSRVKMHREAQCLPPVSFSFD